MRPSRSELLRVAAALGCQLGLASCAAPSPAGAVARPAGAVARPAGAVVPRAPVPPPITTVTGCVESRELHDYVRALEEHRAEARRRALDALGARLERRRGRFAEPGAPALVDEVVLEGGRRFAVVGMLAAGAEPVASLARQGRVLRRIDERPRAFATPVPSCSERRCRPPAPPAPAAGRAPVRPLLIELQPGEELGAPLELAYEHWWADVQHARGEECPGAAQRESSAAKAMP